MRLPRHRRSLPAAPAPVPENAWPVVDEELLKMLPPVLRAVVRALGFGRARAWLTDHGGVNVSIPAYRTQALGLSSDELARLRLTLAPHLDSNGRCTMSKADKLFKLVRDAEIKRSRMSINAQARHYRLSARQIVNIRREDDVLDVYQAIDDEGQFRLF
jgi:hypothetical protein